MLMRPILWTMYKTAREGAQTSIYLATEKGVEKHSGKYFKDCHVSTPWFGVMSDPEKAQKLWEVSKEALV